MTLIRKQLRCTLNSLFLPWLKMYSLLFSLLRPVCIKDSQQNSWRESHSGVKRSISACRYFCQQRPVLASKVSTANLLIATSPVTKLCSVVGSQQEHMLSEITVIGRKSCQRSEYRAKERCRSLDFFQTSWITICWKVIMDFWWDDTKDKLPTSDMPPLKQVALQCSVGKFWTRSSISNSR